MQCCMMLMDQGAEGLGGPKSPNTARSYTFVLNSQICPVLPPPAVPAPACQVRIYIHHQNDMKLLPW